MAMSSGTKLLILVGVTLLALGCAYMVMRGDRAMLFKSPATVGGGQPADSYAGARIEEGEGEFDASAYPGASFAEAFAEKPARRLVLVHAEWCGHCKRLMASGGEWDRAKERLPGIVIEEANEAENADLVQSLSVTSFPAIHIVDADDKSVAQFEGERTEDSIVDFALEHIPEDEG